MNDPLRSKLNLILTALVAFGVGLGIAARPISSNRTASSRRLLSSPS
jgi:hypothetical protein